MTTGDSPSREDHTEHEHKVLQPHTHAASVAGLVGPGGGAAPVDPSARPSALKARRKASGASDLSVKTHVSRFQQQVGGDVAAVSPYSGSASPSPLRAHSPAPAAFAPAPGSPVPMTNNPSHPHSAPHSPNPLAAAKPTRGMVPLSSAPMVTPEQAAKMSKIRVVCYNVLADTYASEAVFPYSNSKYLSWGYRSGNLLRELLSYGADIICLQEVDHFEDFFVPRLAQFGYEGVFKKRPGRKADGLAIFFKAHKFSQGADFYVDFNELDDVQSSSENLPPNSPAPPVVEPRTDQLPAGAAAAAAADASQGSEPGSQPGSQPNSHPGSPLKRSATSPASPILSDASLDDGDGEMVQKRARRASVAEEATRRSFLTNNIAYGIYLTAKDGSALWVVNTHLYWDPQRSDIKLAQAKLLKARCTALRRKYGEKVAMLLCGDLNSTPDSVVYDVMRSKTSSKEVVEDAKDCEDETILQLHSIYKHSREPEFTNFTSKFVGTLDYIFYSPGLVSPICALSIPPREECATQTALPNALYSSDHVAQVTDLYWKNVPAPPTPCRLGLECRNPDCVHIHPTPCPSGMKCQRTDCQLRHITACKYGITCKVLDCTSNHLPCKNGRYGVKCTNKLCQYSHLIPCRFREKCKRKECHFHHPVPLAASQAQKKGVPPLGLNLSSRIVTISGSPAPHDGSPRIMMSGPGSARSHSASVLYHSPRPHSAQIPIQAPNSQPHYSQHSNPGYQPSMRQPPLHSMPPTHGHVLQHSTSQPYAINNMPHAHAQSHISPSASSEQLAPQSLSARSRARTQLFPNYVQAQFHGKYGQSGPGPGSHSAPQSPFTPPYQNHVLYT